MHICAQVCSLSRVAERWRLMRYRRLRSVFLVVWFEVRSEVGPAWSWIGKESTFTPLSDRTAGNSACADLHLCLALCHSKSVVQRVCGAIWCMLVPY